MNRLLKICVVERFHKYKCSYCVSVRNALIVFALFSLLGALVVLVTSIMLIGALRKEYEKKMVPWLYSFAVFTIFRLFAFIFFSIVNDLIFAYNVMMCLLWIVFVCLSVYGWLIVYSLYVELSDLTRLEDLAHLRVIIVALSPAVPFALCVVNRNVNRCVFRLARCSRSMHRRRIPLRDLVQQRRTAPCPPCRSINILSRSTMKIKRA